MATVSYPNPLRNILMTLIHTNTRSPSGLLSPINSTQLNHIPMFQYTAHPSPLADSLSIDTAVCSSPSLDNSLAAFPLRHGLFSHPWIINCEMCFAKKFVYWYRFNFEMCIKALGEQVYTRWCTKIRGVGW